MRLRKTLYTRTLTESNKIKKRFKISLQNSHYIACTKINRSSFTCKKKVTSLKHKSFISI